MTTALSRNWLLRRCGACHGRVRRRGAESGPRALTSRARRNVPAHAEPARTALRRRGSCSTRERRRRASRSRTRCTISDVNGRRRSSCSRRKATAISRRPVHRHRQPRSASLRRPRPRAGTCHDAAAPDTGCLDAHGRHRRAAASASASRSDQGTGPRASLAGPRLVSFAASHALAASSSDCAALGDAPSSRKRRAASSALAAASPA